MVQLVQAPVLVPESRAPVQVLESQVPVPVQVPDSQAPVPASQVQVPVWVLENGT